MKTKLLIELLQKSDPSGEEECCVNNHDILMIHSEPAYYDGPLQILTFEKSRNYHDCFPIGGKIVRKGNKIQITTLSLEDAGFDNWYDGKTFPIELDEWTTRRESERIDEWQKSAERVRKIIDFENNNIFGRIKKWIRQQYFLIKNG